jgi:transposase
MGDTMSKKRRGYSAEFKHEAVELLKRSNDGITAVAQELGVPLTTLKQWHDKTREEEKPPETTDQEVRRLRRENQQLKMERDFLKKAAAFFAKEHK